MTHTNTQEAARPELSAEDLNDLRSTLREFLAEFAGEEQLRADVQRPGGYDRELWSRLATELGVQGLALSEDVGGAGYGLRELQLVQEELGRVLYSGPYFSTVVLAARTIEQSNAERRDEWLAGIVDGSLTATLAFREGTESVDLARVDTRAERDGDTWRLTGSKQFVIDGAGSDLILVPARTDEGIAIFAVAQDQCEAVTLSAFDQTRGLADVTFAESVAQLVIPAAEAGEELERVLRDAGALLAAEQVGAAARVLEYTIQYTHERYQFGRPIGSFQAVKHHAANMLLSLEAARASVDAAVDQLARESEEIVALEEVAAALATDAFVEVVETSVQLHGGMGVTWEHPGHFYLKRAKADELLLRTPRERRQRIARRIDV